MSSRSGRVGPGRCESAEIGHQPGHGVVARRFDRQNLDDEGVAGFRALHDNRPRLRVQIRIGAHIGEGFYLRRHLVFEGIDRVNADRLPGLYPCHRGMKGGIGTSPGSIK